MVGEGHLRVLGAVDGPTTPHDLVRSLDYAASTISNLLGDLEDLELVDRERMGTRVTVRPTEARCVEVYHRVVKTNPHIDVPNLLTESTLVLLYHLSDESILSTTLIERSGLSRATVYRHLNTLQNRAIVLKDESRYRLADDFLDLHTFAVEFYHQHHRRRVTEDTSGGVLLWETHDAFLIQTADPVDAKDYHQTGLAAFAEYDLQFLTTPAQYYFYAPARASLDAFDLVCHLLLIEDDVRHREYAMLLLAKIDASPEELHDRAEHYRMANTVNPLSEYLGTRGTISVTNLPPWHEFKAIADEYGVEV